MSYAELVAWGFECLGLYMDENPDDPGVVEFKRLMEVMADGDDS